MIAVITMFFAGMGAGASLGAALLLTGVILLGIGLTFFASWFLSATFLKGVPLLLWKCRPTEGRRLERWLSALFLTGPCSCWGGRFYQQRRRESCYGFWQISK